MGIFRCSNIAGRRGSFPNQVGQIASRRVAVPLLLANHSDPFKQDVNNRINHSLLRAQLSASIATESSRQRPRVPSSLITAPILSSGLVIVLQN